MRLIYFSPVPWDSYEQRPHYFVRHFLAAGGRDVMWVDPYPSRLPQRGDFARWRDQRAPLTLPRLPSLDVVSVSALPIDPLPGGARLNRRLCWGSILRQLRARGGRDVVVAIGRPTALALAALDEIPHAWSLYDAMDLFPEFYRGRSKTFTEAVERQIAARVTRLLASSTAIADKFRTPSRPVTLVHNAYDMALLPPVTDGPNRGQALGFLGCLGGWFDWDLTVRVALEAAPRPVTLIGPRPSPGPSRLPDNVTWMPECHQSETVTHLRSFAAGLIPFRVDALTRGIDPIKYYQYRGAGLPVLTTGFGEMRARGESDDTFFLDGPLGIRGAIAAATARQPTPSATRAFRDTHTWERRFDTAGLLETQ